MINMKKNELKKKLEKKSREKNVATNLEGGG